MKNYLSEKIIANIFFSLVCKCYSFSKYLECYCNFELLFWIMQESKHDSTTTADPDLEDLHQTPPEEEFDCKLCFFRTNISKAFEKHVRMKHAGGMFQCQHCDYTTTRSGNLKAHSRKHTGEMLQCQHCDYTTAQSGNLKSHSRKHTGEKLQCQYCDYATARSDHLKAYSRKHTGEMFQCQHCDFTTTQFGNLKSHSRKHTGDMLQC